MNGWIYLHKKFLEWGWFTEPNMVSIFVYFLLKCNYEDNVFLGIDIKRGQFVTSISNIAIDTGLSFQQVRTCLKKLKKTKEIEVKTTSKFTTITICNYDSYQTKQQTNNKPTTNQQQTSNKPATTTNKENKDKEVKEIYSAYPTKCPIRGSATGKCEKNKDKISSLLDSKEYTKESLINSIENYIKDCKKNVIFIKNFTTFLNNIPDVEETPIKPKTKTVVYKLPLSDKPNVIYRHSEDKFKRETKHWKTNEIVIIEDGN